MAAALDVILVETPTFVCFPLVFLQVSLDRGAVGSLHFVCAIVKH